MADSAFDLIFRRAIVEDGSPPVDIGVRNGRIAAIQPTIVCDAPEVAVDGGMVFSGFVDSHIHLDKSCLLERCGHCSGGLKEAIAKVAQLKRDFTFEDVYERGARTLEKAIAKGTTRMRTHVEIDPRVELRSFHAVQALKRDYAWGVELSICVFPQEGLTNDPGAKELLIEALKQGADLLGGCPYTDPDPHAQLSQIFDLAAQFDVDLDIHLDFDLDPNNMLLGEVCRQAERHRYQGRVTIGHVTKLSMADHDAFAAAAQRLRDAGVALTVLPATDVYLMGRDAKSAPPRGLTPAHLLADHGVVCSIATNNVLNPFTPFGDCSLLRMANFYANVAHVDPENFALCFDLVTSAPARLMNLSDYGVQVGNPADLVILDAPTKSAALAEISEPIMGFKNGKRSFIRPAAQLFKPKRVSASESADSSRIIASRFTQR